MFFPFFTLFLGIFSFAGNLGMDFNSNPDDSLMFTNVNIGGKSREKSKSNRDSSENSNTIMLLQEQKIHTCNVMVNTLSQQIANSQPYVMFAQIKKECIGQLEKEGNNINFFYFSSSDSQKYQKEIEEFIQNNNLSDFMGKLLKALNIQKEQLNLSIRKDDEETSMIHIYIEELCNDEEYNKVLGINECSKPQKNYFFIAMTTLYLNYIFSKKKNNQNQRKLVIQKKYNLQKFKSFKQIFLLKPYVVDGMKLLKKKLTNFVGPTEYRIQFDFLLLLKMITTYSNFFARKEIIHNFILQIAENINNNKKKCDSVIEKRMNFFYNCFYNLQKDYFLAFLIKKIELAGGKYIDDYAKDIQPVLDLRSGIYDEKLKGTRKEFIASRENYVGWQIEVINAKYMEKILNEYRQTNDLPQYIKKQDENRHPLFSAIDVNLLQILALNKLINQHTMSPEEKNEKLPYSSSPYYPEKCIAYEGEAKMAKAILFGQEDSKE